MDLEEITARLEIHEARAAIHELLYRYARGVDRSDLELIKSIYWPEAVDHHGPFVALGFAFADRLVTRERSIEAVGEHHFTNITIKIDGDDAWVESYFLAFHPHNDDVAAPIDPGAGANYIGVGSGRFLDHVQRREGEWRVLHREVVNDWTRLDMPGAIWPRASWQVGGFTRGRRHDDPSYALFEEMNSGCPGPQLTS